MTPTKVKDLIPEVAAYLEIPEEDLTNILSFYFKENKRKMSELEHLHINFHGLGTFSLMGWLLEKKIKEHRLKIERSSKQENIDKLKEELASFEAARDLWEAEREAKREMAKKKKEFYENKLNYNELEREDPSSLAE